MRIIKMRIVDCQERMKAGFSVITDEGIEIDDFIIVERNGELSVNVPGKKGNDGEWYKKVRMPRELEDRLKQDAIQEYEKTVGRVPKVSDNNAVPF